MTLRVFAVVYAAFLMLTLAGVLVGYRYLVTIPATKDAIDQFHQRELVTLQAALDKELGFLQTMNYDYSVWDASYAFIKRQDPDFISENLIEDTFTSLKIDGILYFDTELNSIFAKGFDHQQQQPVEFTELSDKHQAQLQVLLPQSSDKTNSVAQTSGFIATSQGPVMFSATEIRRSDRSGPGRGSLMFIRKVRPGLIQSLQTISQLNLTAHAVTDARAVADIPVLDGKLYNERFLFKRQRLISDPSGNPVLLLTIEHQVMSKPEIFDTDTLLALALLICIPLAMWWFVNYYLVSPVSSSAKVIRKMINTRQFNPILNQYPITELQSLGEDFNELINVVNQQRYTLEQLVLTDGLTGVANRRAFEHFIENSWARMNRNAQPLAIVMCDVDYFKPYNDHYGHQAGDETLINIAQALQSTINRSGDLVARYGGEEFVIVIADSNLENCQAVTNRALQAVRNLNIPHQFSKAADIITISCGCAYLLPDKDKPLKGNHEPLLAAADSALYQAKQNGRDRAEIVQYQPKPDNAFTVK